MPDVRFIRYSMLLMCNFNIQGLDTFTGAARSTRSLWFFDDLVQIT